MILTEFAFIESRSLRDGQLANTTHERAEDVLAKAKALMHFAMHQGNKIATSEQVAEFYEVTVDAVRMAYSRHKDELVTDGVREIRGSELKTLRCIGHDILLLPNSVTRLTIWNPRGTLRLGMLLRDSAVAKAVRTASLDTNEESGKKSERIQELEIERDIAQAHAAALMNERVLFEQRKLIYEFHGETGLLVIDGKQPIEIEKPTIETIDEKSKTHFKGQTLPQVVEYIKKRYGVRLKNGGTVKKILKTTEKDSLIAHIPRVVLQEYIPQEHLEEVYKLLNKGDRQMLLGE